MKCSNTAIVLTVSLLATASVAHSADVTLSVDVASAYVFRGATFNDGPVLQPAIDVAGLPIPLTLGVWANMDLDDYDKTLDEGQFSEVDFYFAYAMPRLVDGLNWEIGYSEYTYPLGGKADREASVVFEIEAPLAPSLGVYYGLDGAIEQDLYIEADIGHTIKFDDLDLNLGAAIGYLNPDSGNSGFSHYTLSAAIAWQAISASIAYFGQIDDDVLPTGKGAYDVEVVGMIGLAYTF